MTLVAVTGGAGFVGAALVQRLLADGHEVDVIDNFTTGSMANLAEARRDADGRLKIQQLDTTDEAVVAHLARRGPEVVVHLASRVDHDDGFGHPSEIAVVNVVGAHRVIEGVIAAGARKFVHVVSATACYDPAESTPIQEDCPRTPRTPSASTRARLGEVAEAHRVQGHFEFTELVVGNIYGPGQVPGRRGSVVASVVDALASGAPARVEGTGKQVRDFVYIDDAVDALVRTLDRADGSVCHVGTGVGTTIHDLIRAVAAELQVKPLAVSAPPRPASVDYSVLDSARAAIRLGWKSWTPLSEGLRQTVSGRAGRT